MSLVFISGSSDGLGLLAARLLGQLGADEDLLGSVIDGGKVATLAFHDVARQPVQWLSGGAHADRARRRMRLDMADAYVPADDPQLFGDARAFAG